MNELSVRMVSIDTIELHYWLKDGLHSMDAHVFNRCEYEFLGIVNEVSSKLKLHIEVEVEPLGEGGIRSWIKFGKEKGKEIKIAFLIFFLTQVMCTPLTTSLDYVTKKALECIFEDRELKELLKEKEKAELKLEIAKLKLETQKQCDSLDENRIKKKRSNYFEEASKCSRIEKVSILATDTYKNNQFWRNDILATEFDQFVMTSNDLDPDYDENATIEIISPVLKKGKFQWLGIYNGGVIQFKMKSAEFKEMVLTGQVPFKNGSSITCLLVTSKTIDSQGDVKIAGYEVTEVYNFFENETPIETPAGRRRRQKREDEEKQLSLFGEDAFNN